MYRGLTNGSSYSYLQSVYNYTSGANKLNTVSLSGVTSRAFAYDLTGNTTQETFGGVNSNYSFGRSNLPINFIKSGVTTNYVYSASDERIIKHNTSTNGLEYYIKSTGGEDIAVFTAATNSLLWYVQGEVKFPHHTPSDFSANNSNTGATSYTTDPYNIALSQTNSYLYPDMEYKLTDHLGSTRMTYKLNFTCGAVYQNANIQYMADYYSFGKIVREYINPGTAAEKYQYTGKERDTESGYDYFNARNYHSEVGRFLSVDPMAGKYTSLSPYNYTMNNPIRFIDPDGMEVETDFLNTDSRQTLHVEDGKNQIALVSNEQFNQVQGLSSASSWNRGQSDQYEGIINSSSVHSMDSDLGILSRLTYSEMAQGNDNAKAIVAESAVNRTELKVGSHENPDGTLTSAINIPGAYDVTSAKSKRNDEFKNPETAREAVKTKNGIVLKSSYNQTAWLSSIAASYNALNGSNVGNGTIFYHSGSSTFRDNSQGYEKVNLNVMHTGIKGTWKLK